MSKLTEARIRYKQHRLHTRELLEHDALHCFRKRVDVVTIDEDITRRVERDWTDRKVAWDWENGIMRHHRSAGPRGFDFAFVVSGQLCGLAAGRLSPNKRWLSLTHVEGAPGEHPLKGRVLPLVIRGIFIYRGVIAAENKAENIGVRLLNPLDETLPYYEKSGYTLTHSSKWLRSIVIAEPTGETE